MATFTALVPLNLHWYGNALVGAVGATHRIPDAMYDEFHVEVEPNIKGGVTWTSLVDDSNPTVVTLSSLTATTARFKGSPWIDAKAYGATGDGVTDDTTALQAAINALTSATIGELFIPPGTYKITSALTLPFIQGKVIRGVNQLDTVISQATNSIPIIKTQYEDTHSITLRDMTLAYVNQQTSSAAMAIQFTATSAGVGSGFYHWEVSNLLITKAAIGIGISGTGYLPVWQSRFENIRCTAIKSRAIYMVTNGGLVGLVFRKIAILNTNTAVVSDNVAIAISATEGLFDQIDVEGWYGPVFYGDGGSPAKITQLHIEHHVNTTAGALIQYANGPLTVEDSNISIATVSASGATVAIFNGFSSAQLDLSQILVAATITAGTVVYASMDSTCRAWVRNLAVTAGAISNPAHSADATTLARLVANTGAYGFGVPIGTAFPSPAILNQHFVRSDLNLEFFYNGTRWLSAQGFTLSLASRAAQPYAATTDASRAAAANAFFGASDLWVEKLYTSYYVVAGTALSGSNKWVGNGNGVAVTVTIASGASDTWRQDSQTINALIGTAGVGLYGLLDMDWVKTGTPGNLRVAQTYTLRLVAA